MAKFAIAFCIFLVACSEAHQGSLLSTITNSAASMLSSAVSDAEKQVKTVQKAAETVTDVTGAMTGLVKDAVTSTTGQLTETMSSIATSVTSPKVDVSTCFTLNKNFERVAQGIAATAIAAVNGIRSNLLARSHTILAALRNFITLATGYLTKLNACGSSIETFVKCIPSMIPSVENLMSSGWTTLSADVSSLGNDLATFTSLPLSTGLDTAIKNLESEAKKSVTKFQKCIAALTSVASSPGR